MHRFLLFCFSLICLNHASPEGFRHLSTHNGLSNKRTFSIEKDRTGFIWISTRAGIDRYDGQHIKQYKLLNEKSEDIAGRINMLAKDRSENLWAYTNNGHIFLYDADKDAYVLRFNLPERIPNPDTFLNGICFTSENRLFIFGTFGLWSYVPASDRLQEITSYRQRNIYTMKEIGHSKYAIGTQEDLFISEMDASKDSISCRNLLSERLHERVQCLYFEEFNNTLLIGTFSGKLFTYDIFRRKLSDVRYSFNESIRDIESYNNTFFIATDGAGLIRINRDNKKIQEAHSYFGEENTANNPYSIYNLLIDDNRLWAATYANGVYIYDDNLPSFKFIRLEKRSRNPNRSIDAVLEDRNGNIWYGTNDGISKYNTRTGQWQYLSKTAGMNIKKYNTLALCEDDAGMIWAGGFFGASAICIDPVSLQIRQHLHIPNQSGTTGTSRPYAIFNDSEGMIWLGGLHCLLTRYNPHARTFKQYKIKSVNTIVEKGNTLMAGTAQGLYILDKNTDTFVEFLSAERTASVMRSFINTIHEDNQGILWLGTEGGLLRYDRKQDLLNIYTKDNGLLSNSLYGVLPDRRGRLWISTEAGLSCYDPVSGEFINFGMEEGLADERFKARSFFKKSNGELVFGTVSGAVCFIPEVIDRLNIKSKLVLTELSIFYHPVYPNEKNSPLQTVIDKTKRMRLQYFQDTFSFEFTSINYTNPHASRFEWCLKSYDKDWINQKDANTALYTNVPPGKYTFEVRLVNKDNLNVIDSKSIDMEIASPFWASVLARIIYIFLMSGLVWIIIQFIKAQMEKKNASEKIQFFTSTAHELKTPVTLIKGPLDKLQENSQWEENDRLLLNLAAKNTDRLYKLVTQLLDFQKTAKDSVKLTLSEHDLNEYMKDRMELFQQSALQKDIQLRFVTGEPISVWFDVEKMDKIISNLLSNAIRYTPSKGNIQVTLSSGNRYWAIEIKDSGIGIPQKHRKDIFKPFFRAENAVNFAEGGTGIGLSLVKNLAALHGGNISLESADGKGSVFTLTFPYGKNHFDAGKCIFIEKEVSNEAASDAEILTPAEETSDSNKTIIVIAEDNPDVRSFLKQELKDKYAVLEAVNGKEAIRIVKNSDCELIISDIMMPEMSGYELCTQIKTDKETSHIPIILLTALDDRENVRKGYLLGADNYITKPFDLSILRMTIENTIATRQALRKNLVLPLEQEITEELNTNPLDKAFIDEVIAIIDRNIDDSEFSIDDVCREVAMSRSSFFKKLKILTDQGPNNFIRIVRLNRAAKMIKERKYTITEIAYATGFGDVKYFSTAFKKHFGKSPSRYNSEYV
jgi:signal transduction histidine kinase/ligand-binding sensor domain-containing protein/DNA-binding response OmpR family regulator